MPLRNLALAVGLLAVASTVQAGTIDLGSLLERGKALVTVGGKELTFETDDAGLIITGSQKIKNDAGQDVAELSIQAMLDADPFIGYGISATNLTGGDLDFAFSFSSPYILGPYNVLDSSHSSSVTDGGGGPTNDSVIVKPIAPDAFIHLPTIDGSTILAASLAGTCTVNPPGGGGGSDTCVGSAFASVPVVTDPSGTFGLKVNFTLSAHDIWTGNGRVELLSVPDEASTALLLALAIGVMFLVAQRRVPRAL